jgi:hypothetical protein
VACTLLEEEEEERTFDLFIISYGQAGASFLKNHS